MTRAAVLALALLAFAPLAGCDKGDKAAPASGPAKPTEAPATAGTKGADGHRHIAIEVNKEGYTPERIVGKPNEALTLEFTRTADSSCIAQLKAPDGKMVDLPLGKQVDVPVTVPPTGQLAFACGMDMFHGEVVAQP